MCEGVGGGGGVGVAGSQLILSANPLSPPGISCTAPARLHCRRPLARYRSSASLRPQAFPYLLPSPHLAHHFLSRPWLTCLLLWPHCPRRQVDVPGEANGCSLRQRCVSDGDLTPLPRDCTLRLPFRAPCRLRTEREERSPADSLIKPHSYRPRAGCAPPASCARPPTRLCSLVDSEPPARPSQRRQGACTAQGARGAAPLRCDRGFALSRCVPVASTQLACIPPGSPAQPHARPLLSQATSPQTRALSG